MQYFTKTSSVFIPVQYGTDEWLESRKRFEITASMAPDLLGYGYRSRIKRWKIAVGMDEDAVSPYQESIMNRGREMESHALSMIQELWPASDARAIEGMYFSSDKPWLGATPDGTMTLKGKIIPLEIKCPVDSLTFCYDWRKFFKFRIQLEVQMRCMHASGGLLFIYHPVQTCWWYFVKPNDELWQCMLSRFYDYRECLRLKRKPEKMYIDHEAFEKFVKRRLEF